MNATEYCICGHEKQEHAPILPGHGCTVMVRISQGTLQLCFCTAYEPEPEHKRMARLGPEIAPRLLL